VTRVSFAACLCAISGFLLGCDADKVARLEKQNQELEAQFQRQRAASDLDSQAKCSRDAKVFFTEGWQRDKDTILLDHSNHYNKKENKCFVLVELHYNSHFAGPGGDSWTNDMALYDVYENIKYGNFAESHYTYYKPTITNHDEMLSCDVSGQKCKSIQEFNSLAGPYMNN
jgi:hypothetical protein